MASVLLIDDNTPARELLRAMLVAMGHVVRDAADGAAGLRLYDKQPCDVLITDIVMPEEDGLGLIRALRERSATLKILAISGGGQRLPAGDCLEMAEHFGAQRTLKKPFTRAELEQALAEMLAGAV